MRIPVAIATTADEAARTMFDYLRRGRPTACAACGADDRPPLVGLFVPFEGGDFIAYLVCSRCQSAALTPRGSFHDGIERTIRGPRALDVSADTRPT